jgi:hypothetical protein
MEKLKDSFNKNGMHYDVVDTKDIDGLGYYLCKVSSLESGRVCGYEVGRVVKSKGGVSNIGGVDVEFKAKELIISNEQFGRFEHEGFYSKKGRAVDEFNLIGL